MPTAKRPTLTQQPDRITQVNGFTVREYNVPTPEQLARFWEQVGPLVAMLLAQTEQPEVTHA